MKSISRIQKYLTVATIAAVMGFGMLFISPAQPVQAQSPSQSALQEMINTLLAQIAVLQQLVAQQEGGGNPPAASPVGTTISVGDAVRVIDGPLSIRTNPGGSLRGVAQTNDIAVVLAGPQMLDGYTWWQLDYRTGADGWSAADWLVGTGGYGAAPTTNTGTTNTSTNSDTSASTNTANTTNTSAAASGELGTFTASISNTGIAVSTRNGITKAAAQSLCDMNLKQWKFQYESLGFSEDLIVCEWNNGSGNRWTKNVGIDTGSAGDTNDSSLGDDSASDTNTNTVDGWCTPASGDNSEPYGAFVTLGDAEVGEQLLARDNGIRDDNCVDRSTGRYQWLRDGSAISGATSQGYTIQSADAGASISVRYSYTDGAGNQESMVSQAKTVPGTPPTGGGSTNPPATTATPVTNTSTGDMVCNHPMYGPQSAGNTATSCTQYTNNAIRCTSYCNAGGFTDISCQSIPSC